MHIMCLLNHLLRCGGRSAVKHATAAARVEALCMRAAAAAAQRQGLYEPAPSPQRTSAAAPGGTWPCAEQVASCAANGGGAAQQHRAAIDDPLDCSAFTAEPFLDADLPAFWAPMAGQACQEIIIYAAEGVDGGQLAII